MDIVRELREPINEAVEDLTEKLTRDVHAVIDLKHMVVSTLVRDKEILNRLVKEVAEPEMRFIVRSGVPFGFAIGCVQALAYALTKSPLIMPIFGFSTGWITDFVASGVQGGREVRHRGRRDSGWCDRRAAGVLADPLAASAWMTA